MRLKNYPQVMSEDETLDLLLQGRSIARYGDGELKHVLSRSNCSQGYHPDLSKRIADILKQARWVECLVGIPNLKQPPPPDKINYWHNCRDFGRLTDKKHVYASSFISRPDCAPWINRPEYWLKFKRLWLGKEVTLVRGSNKSFTPERLVGAKSVREILAPANNAWGEYEALLKRVGTPELVILCLGPTATVMAVDLCHAGCQALDLGHAGMFMRRRPEFASDEGEETEAAR